MTAFQDGIFAFFAAVGVVTLVWLAAGALLHAGRPVIPDLLLALSLRGEAPAMEQDVREIRRVLRQLPASRLVLVDCGLSDEARRLARYLADREEGAELVTAEEFRLR